jgi:sulfhydrogenase subunit beta (sulfur reductase)
MAHKKSSSGASAVADRDAPKVTPLKSGSYVVYRQDFDLLIPVLRDLGYQVIGPTVRDGAIVNAPLEEVGDLPAGWTDEQEAGRYRLLRRTDQALFGYVNGARSWKYFLNPPEVRLIDIQGVGSAFQVSTNTKAVHDGGEAGMPPPRFAFLGIRPCDLAAIGLLDRVFVGENYRDPVYNPRRAGAFFISVNCTRPAATCFCNSMDTGPAARSGYDLCLTELLEPEHRFYVETGSEAGCRVLGALRHRPATDAERQAAERASAGAAGMMRRSVDPQAAREALNANLESPRWQEVAKKCLACTNCTMACPTCFCSTLEDSSDITGLSAARWRRWDSCFTLNYSYIHGGSVRPSLAARYRQWLCHKFSYWWDQFGAAGCTGCGRCITWCPAGIDVTEQLRALR